MEGADCVMQFVVLLMMADQTDFLQVKVLLEDPLCYNIHVSLDSTSGIFGNALYALL